MRALEGGRCTHITSDHASHKEYPEAKPFENINKVNSVQFPYEVHTVAYKRDGSTTQKRGEAVRAKPARRKGDDGPTPSWVTMLRNNFSLLNILYYKEKRGFLNGNEYNKKQF